MDTIKMENECPWTLVTGRKCPKQITVEKLTRELDYNRMRLIQLKSIRSYLLAVKPKVSHMDSVSDYVYQSLSLVDRMIESINTPE